MSSTSAIEHSFCFPLVKCCKAVVIPDVLAQVVIVSTTFTFSEEDIKAFRHIHTEELVPIRNYGSECCKEDSFRDGVISKELAPEGSDLKVEFDNQSAVETLYFRQMTSFPNKRDRD